MVLHYFKSGPIRGLLICFSCIFLFMLLSGHWTFTKSTIKEKHSPEPKSFYLQPTVSSMEKHSTTSTIAGDIPVTDENSRPDVLPDPRVEFANISVLREEMMKG